MPHNLPTYDTPEHASRMDTKGEQKRPPVTVFVATAILIFFCTLSVFDSIGFVPDYIDGTVPAASASQDGSTDLSSQEVVAVQGIVNSDSSISPESSSKTSTGTAAQAAATHSGILPSRIIIPSIDLDLAIQNPSTRNVDALDALLVNGPARYVDSAELGENGNVLIFAHSSHLPIVHNKMFQAFNQIPNLSQGDTITIRGNDGKDYLYSVDSVVKASTDDGTTIDLSASQGKKLTLVTCDTLTGKSARFILTASFVGVTDAQ